MKCITVADSAALWVGRNWHRNAGVCCCRRWLRHRIVFVVRSNFYLSVIYNPPLTKLDGGPRKAPLRRLKWQRRRRRRRV